MELESRLQALEQKVMLGEISNKQVLTTREAAVYLGWSMSYLYQQTKLHMIPHYCPMGKTLYFDRLELEEWMKRNRVKTNDEAQNEALSYAVLGRKGGKK